MNDFLRRNLGAVIFTVSIHAVLLIMLLISFDWTPKPHAVASKPNVVEAVAVDANKVKAELDKLKQAEARKKKQEQDRVARLKREEQQARRKRAEEEKRLSRLNQQRAAAEKKRKAEEARLAKLKQQQAAAQQKAEAEEKKRKAEQARLAKLKKEQEALRKKQEAEKKRKAALKAKQEAEAKRRQQELAEQLAAEEAARAEQVANREIDRYIVLIKQKINRNWLKPAGSSKGLVSKVKVRLIPGGEVIDVKVIKSSGNAVYDRSVERAVRKASPLPLPKDPAIAARMYDIEFNFAAET